MDWISVWMPFNPDFPHLVDIFLTWLVDNHDEILDSAKFAVMFLFATQMLSTLQIIFQTYKQNALQILVLVFSFCLAIVYLYEYDAKALGESDPSLTQRALELTCNLGVWALAWWSGLELLNLTLDRPIAVWKSFAVLFVIILVLFQFRKDRDSGDSGAGADSQSQGRGVGDDDVTTSTGWGSSLSGGQDQRAK